VYKIEKFDEMLKQRLPVLKQFKIVIQKNIEGFGASNYKISSLMSALDQFEDVFMEYTKDITKTSQKDPMSGSYGSKFGIFKELQTNQDCPYYDIEAFINNEISDYEAFIEAIKTQRNFLSNRRSVRYQLDKQLELFNKLGSVFF
jgi:hypothetical protein